ncbi:hypothetical protein Tco_1556521 [Tanacetum coccineum]
MNTKVQQSALDNALVAPENQRVIGKCNMRINPGMKPKEPNYQVVLDALALTTCYPAFLITTEVHVIYMHQFWATINKHNASYRFKIDNKRFSINVEVFREILNICPRIPGQEFDEPPSEEEALSFIRELGHSRDIKYITDVIVDHLHQPWRTFASIINKCLYGKIDNKDSKKQDKMFYPRFMKIIIHHFLEKYKSISMRKRTFMHTARDDSLLGTMRFVLRHEDTQVYGALLPKAMTNEAMLDFIAYKTYYAIASGAEPPKLKKTKTKSNSAILSEENPSKKKPTKAKKDVPSTKKPATKPKPTKKKASDKANRGKSLNILSEVALSEAAQLKEVTKLSKKDFNISHASGSSDGTDFQSGVPDEQQRQISGTDEGGDSGEEEDDDEDDTEDDKGNDDGDDSDGNDYDDDDDDNDGDDKNDADNANEENEEELDDGEELYKDTNMNLRKEDVEITDADQSGADQHNVSQESGFEQEEEDAHVTLTTVHDAQKTEGPMQSSSISFDFTEKLLNFENVSPADNEIASLMNTTVCHEEPSGQTSTLFTVPIKQVDQYAQAISSIPAIVDRYINNKLGEAIHKILLDKIEESKSHLRVDYKRKLYDALVNSYNTNKDHFNTYGEVFTLKKSRDDKDKDQDPSAGSDRGTKRRKSSKEAESLKDQRLKEGKSSSSSKGTSRSHHKSSSKSAHAEEPSHTVDNSRFKKPERPLTPDPDWNKRQRVDFRLAQTWICVTTRAEKSPTLFDELIDTPIDFSAFVMNRLNITNLTQEFMVGPVFNLLKGTCKSLTELEYHFEECSKAKIERLDWHNPEGKSYSFDVRKPLLLIPDHRGHQVIPQDYFINNDLEYLKVTILKIMKWYDYGHLDEIKVRREDQQLYTFKEGDFPRLRLQDIEDMLLLLVQQRLTNLTVDECYDLNVALRMFTRRIIIQRRVEDLQLVVKSYQKKLNLTKPDTFRSNLRNKTAYTAYSYPQGLIYKDHNNRNRLIRTNELHKFSDGTLNDVHTALHDIASGIRMEYLPKRKWSGLDKRRARVMIQDIDKQLFQRRLMRNLEKFVGRREYGEHLRLLTRIICLRHILFYYISSHSFIIINLVNM